MNRLLKILALAIAGIVVLVIVAVVALVLLFEPNDFRDSIAAEVKTATGRELVIEGDIAATYFPWLAIEIGRTRMGNAEGFGDTPFATFESARLSVRLMPLIFKSQVIVSKAELESLRLELAVNSQGTNNWDDLAGNEAADAANAESGGGPASLDVSSVEIRDAFIHYNDAQSKSDYTLQNLTLNTGRITLGEAFDFSSTADFVSKADEIDGNYQASGKLRISDEFAKLIVTNFELEGTANGIAARAAGFDMASDELVADLNNSTLQPTKLKVRSLGLNIDLDIKSMSWATDTLAESAVSVSAFSPREVFPLFDVEMPETADPSALGRMQFTAAATLAADTLAFRNLQLKLDDTAFSGEVTLPVGNDAAIRFDLQGDSMNLDRYMAPATVGGAAGSAPAADDDFEIPVELIRSINARGKLQLKEAVLSGMTFTNIQLGLTSGGGKLRLNPLSANLFDGTYTGDVQIDASGAMPALSLNEKVADVNLSPLGKAMFERDKLSGTINGNFILKARGATLSAMRRNLNGTMAFELADGAWLGVDIWYQLRTARALYRREQPPAKREPVRTDFSSVLATGLVTDGVFSNNDLQAEMPFLQITGGGTVDLVAGEMDYSLRARVLERPEFLRGATEAELAEFTEALIPVRVRGPITDPSIRPDIEAMFREEVDNALKKKGDELKKRLLDRLAPPAPANTPPPGAAAPGEETGEAGEVPAGEEPPAEEKLSPEDQLKQRLKKIFD